MADQKTVEGITSKAQQSSLLFILSVIVIVLIIGAAVYFSLQKATITGQNEQLDGEIASLQTEINLLEGEKVEAARTAQEWLAEVNEQEILWSRVISRIQSLIPYDATTQQAKVQFLSYSGATNGRLSLNAQTRNTKRDPFSDVAEVITVFNDTSFFNNAIVPTVTRGENDQGDRFATFNLDMEYRETIAEDIVSGTADDEFKGGVSR